MSFLCTRYSNPHKNRHSLSAMPDKYKQNYDTKNELIYLKYTHFILPELSKADRDKIISSSFRFG